MPASHTNKQPFILSGIQPTLHPKAVLFLACQTQKPEHLLHQRLLSLLSGQLRPLKSRHPFATLELLNDPAQSGISVAQWAEYNVAWNDGKTTLNSLHLLKMLAQHLQELAF